MPKPQKPAPVETTIRRPRKLVIPTDDPPASPAPIPQPAEPTPPAARLVRVTTELKRCAEALLVTMDALPLDDVEAVRIETVRLKHYSEGNAIHTAAAVNKLLGEFHARGALPFVGADVRACGVIVDVPAELVWKCCWGEALEDVAHTSREHVEVDVGVVPLATKVGAAFRPENIVRIELLSDSEAEIGTGGNSVLRRRFDEGWKCQAFFAKALKDAVVPEEALRIAVTVGNLGRLSVEVNGEPIEFGKKNSPLKALLILALFRRRERFSVKDFAKLYVGRAEADSLPGKTFSNAIRELDKIVGAFAVEKHTAERSVPGIVFTQAPSDEHLREQIAGLPHREST